MSKDSLAELAAQLGARPPGGLKRLSAEQLGDLANAVREARRRQAEELAAAGEQALRHIPRLLRRPVRMVMR
jgi:hypothetical protein